MLTNNFSNNNVFFKDNREKETFVEFIGKLCQFKKLNLQGLKHWHINHVLEFGGTEFDLLSIGEILINVELKSQFPKGGISAVKEQLAKSKHYLNHINDECFFFTYIKGEGFYQYQNENIEKVNLDALVEKINLQKSSKQEIKDLFRPSEFLVSPLNDWKKFLNRKYYLTQQQEGVSSFLCKFDF